MIGKTNAGSGGYFDASTPLLEVKSDSNLTYTVAEDGVYLLFFSSVWNHKNYEVANADFKKNQIALECHKIHHGDTTTSTSPDAYANGHAVMAITSAEQGDVFTTSGVYLSGTYEFKVFKISQ